MKTDKNLLFIRTSDALIEKINEQASLNNTTKGKFVEGIIQTYLEKPDYITAPSEEQLKKAKTVAKICYIANLKVPKRPTKSAGFVVKSGIIEDVNQLSELVKITPGALTKFMLYEELYPIKPKIWGWAEICDLSAELNVPKSAVYTWLVTTGRVVNLESLV